MPDSTEDSMYLLRRFSRLLLAVTLAVFAVFIFKHRSGVDTRGPVIHADGEVMEVSVKDGEEILLEGITANDSSDGDVTDSVEVENISTFYGDRKRLVTYVAFDSDQHVARATRELRYTDYESPKFSLTEPLQFLPGNVNLKVSAEDCLDGDITSAIKLVVDNPISTDQPGQYNVTFQVANSAGDVSSLKVALEIMENQAAGTPVIKLKKYLDYVRAGRRVDLSSYIDTVQIAGREYRVVDGDGNFNTGADPGEEIVIGSNLIGIQGDVDTHVPGTYKVVFTMTLDRGENNSVSGHTVLYIVVR